MVEGNWQRRDADASSTDLIGEFQLQIQPPSALAYVLVAAEWFCMLTARDLHRRERGFVEVFGAVVLTRFRRRLWVSPLSPLSLLAIREASKN